MTPRAYSSPLRFKEALEQRLRNATQGGEAFARKRQLLVFDRFLARAVAELGDSIVLKGGLVLELRLDRARTTKDVDLRMAGVPDELLPRLQASGRLDLGDFMMFEVGPNPDGAEIDNDGLRYEGLRFRAECRLAVRFPEPPTAWATPYAAMARADALPWPDLAAATEAARRFLEPVLEEHLDAVWEPAEAVWQHR